MEWGRGCPLTSLEPRTSDRVLILGTVFVDELDQVLDLVEGFVEELKLVLDLIEGFLEEQKLVLVLAELFCLLVQQLCHSIPYSRLEAYNQRMDRVLSFFSGRWNGTPTPSPEGEYAPPHFGSGGGGTLSCGRGGGGSQFQRANQSRRYESWPYGDSQLSNSCFLSRVHYIFQYYVWWQQQKYYKLLKTKVFSPFFWLVEKPLIHVYLNAYLRFSVVRRRRRRIFIYPQPLHGKIYIHA